MRPLLRCPLLRPLARRCGAPYRQFTDRRPRGVCHHRSSGRSCRRAVSVALTEHRCRGGTAFMPRTRAPGHHQRLWPESSLHLRGLHDWRRSWGVVGRLKRLRRPGAACGVPRDSAVGVRRTGRIYRGKDVVGCLEQGRCREGLLEHCVLEWWIMSRIHIVPSVSRHE